MAGVDSGEGEPEPETETTKAADSGESSAFTGLQTVVNSLIATAVLALALAGSILGLQSLLSPAGNAAPCSTPPGATTVQDGEPTDERKAAAQEVRQLERALVQARAQRDRETIARTKQRLQRERDRADDLEPATVEISAGSSTSLKFGSAGIPGTRSFAFTLSKDLGDATYLSVRLSRLTPSSGGREIDETGVEAWAELSGGGTTGSVVLCLAPRSSDEGDDTEGAELDDSELRTSLPAGIFSGVVNFDDPRVEPLSVPVEVSLSTTSTGKVYLVFTATWLIASMYTYFLRRPDIEKLHNRSEVPPGDPAVFRLKFDFFLGYWRFATGVLGVLTIVAGFLGAFAAFGAAYLDADVWVGSPGDWSKLVGAVATSFIAAATAGKIAQNQFWAPGTTSKDPSAKPDPKPDAKPDPKPGPKPAPKAKGKKKGGGKP